MPDLYAHFTTVYLTVPRKRSAAENALLVFGVVLPDLPARAGVIALQRLFEVDGMGLLGAFHTPMGFLLLCYLLGLMFEVSFRRIAFINLSAGCLLHFLLDLLQEPFHLGLYMPFYPFSDAVIHFDLFHYNLSVYLFPILLLASLLRYRRDCTLFQRGSTIGR